MSKKRLLLSCGLSTPFELILWDEPLQTTWISKALKLFEEELQNSNKTYVIISHDRYLLNHVTNKIFHIDRALINSFSGTYLEYLEYLETSEAERVKQIERLENTHRRELAWMRQGIKARGTRSKKKELKDLIT